MSEYNLEMIKNIIKTLEENYFCAGLGCCDCKLGSNGEDCLQQQLLRKLREMRDGLDKPTVCDKCGQEIKKADT